VASQLAVFPELNSMELVVWLWVELIWLTVVASMELYKTSNETWNSITGSVLFEELSDH
jgi:hypothetical protein